MKNNGYKKRKAKKVLMQKSVSYKNEQFEKIKALIEEFTNNNEPVISMDTKKKNLLEICKTLEVFLGKKQIK